MRRVLLVCVLGLFAAACRENVENSYGTYQQAVADGAVRRGWLPEWLPPTATNIREWHNVDTNATYVSFTYGQAKPSDFLAFCERTSGVALPSHRGWPITTAERSVLQYYRCAEKDSFVGARSSVHQTWVAIDPPRTKAYFWR